MNLPLKTRVDLIPNVRGFAVDCRLLFMGDRLRQIVRTYEEIVHRFKEIEDPQRLYKNLTGSDEIQQFYEVHYQNGVTSVTLKQFAFQERASLDDLKLDVRFQLESNSYRHPLPLNQLAALGNLLPLLRKDISRTEIELSLSKRLNRDEALWAKDLLFLLSEKRFTTDVPLPENHFASKKDGARVTFMGHSSLLFQTSETAVFADPMLRIDKGLPTYAMDVARFPLSAIVSSHSHWDHCDLQSFLWFDKDTQLIIPRVQQPTVFNPPIVEAMRAIGFTNILEAELWRPIQIGDIELIPVPFYGEQDEPDAIIDHFTYVLRSGDFSVYGGVDSYRDTYGEMIPVLERVKESYHPVMAFLPVSKMTYRYEWGGVNGFCRYLDTNLLNQSFQYTASSDEAAQWVKALQPKWVSPYATFNFSPWSTPPEVPQFEKALQRVGLKKCLYPLRPFESLESSHFNAASSRELTRRTLVKWFEVGSTVRRYDRRMQNNRIYRYLRNRKRQVSVQEPHH